MTGKKAPPPLPVLNGNRFEGEAAVASFVSALAECRAGRDTAAETKRRDQQAVTAAKSDADKQQKPGYQERW